MTEMRRNFLIGLTGVVALLSLIALLMLFGELDRFTEPRYVLTINTDHAAGLREGSPVELNGVPIGVVDEVRVQTHREYPVRITALIEEDVLIAADAAPYAAASLIGGSAVLQIFTPLHSDVTNTLPQDGTAVMSDKIRFRMVEQITAELDARMAPVMDSLARFDELSAQYIEFGKNLNEIVSAQDVEAIEGGETPNLRSAIGRLYDVLGETESALALARTWLEDEQLRADARSAVAKAGDLIDRATKTLERFETLASEVEQDSQALVEKLLPVAEELSTTLQSVRKVTQLASEGEGTVGLMLREPDLYLSLEDAAQRLEKTLRDIQLFMRKAKAEGVPIDL
jgi:phospholipid/cholesterol/gamma-HCH transport system substrate-binding protein